MYIWISENNLDQRLMINKTFSAKILVNANQKKSNDLLTKVIKDNNPLKTDTPDFSRAAVSQEYYNTLEDKTHYIIQNGLYKDIDDDGDTYYFRGHVENNYVKLGTKLWRIVRINGNNTIRLIDNDIEGTSAFSYNGDEKYVGYTYDNSEANRQDGKNSIIKTYIDNWYSENMASTTDLSKNFDKLIANTRFCNDTTVLDTDTSTIYYTAVGRLVNDNNKRPTYKCPNTTKTYGGEYDLKEGLLEADEVSFAGALWNMLNTSYYLHKGIIYWIGSPYNFTDVTSEFTVDDNGKLGKTSVSATFGVVPVISLRSDIIFISGDGTKEKPYLVSAN